MPNNLAINITVAGNADAKRALNDIARAVRETADAANNAGAGWRSFSGIASQLLSSMSGLGAGAQTVGAAFRGMHGAVGDLIPDFEKFVGIGAAAAFVGLSKSAADATHALQTQAETLGLTVDRFEGLRYAAGVSGVSMEGFTRGMDRFISGVGRALREQDTLAAAARVAADKLQQSERAVTDAVAASANSLARASTAWQEAKNSIIDADRSLDSAQRGLARARQALADFYKPPSEAELRQRREAELKENVQLAQEQVEAADRRRDIAAQKEREAGAAVLQERQRADEALLAATKEHWRAMDEAAAQGAAATGQHRQGISQQLREVAASGIGGAGADVIAQLGAYADKLKELGTAAEQAAVARQDFGRGFAEMMPFLRQGRQGIEDLVKASEQFRITATPAEEEMSRQFITSWTQMTTAAEGLKNALGNIIGQAFAPIFTGIAQFLASNAETFRAWAQGVVSVVQSVFAGIKAVADLIAGIFGGSGSGLLISLGAALTAFTAISTALRVLGFVLGPVAGGFTLVAGAMELVGTAARLITTTPLGLVMLAIAAAALVVYANWDKIEPVVTRVWTAFRDFASWVATGLVDAFQTLIGWIEKVIDIAERAISAVGKLFAGGGQVVASAGNPPGLATGGPVNGPRGTDRVPIWATAGEFVHNVAAVQHYGVGFMQAINSRSLPRFALGGLVSDILPSHAQHFAEGGAVEASSSTGRTPVHLHIGGEQYDLETDGGTATRLTRFSRSKQTRMTGTMPTWKTATGS